MDAPAEAWKWYSYEVYSVLAIVLLALPTPPPVVDSLWKVEPADAWITVDNLAERVERTREDIAVKCGAAHPADDAVDLRFRALPGRRLFVDPVRSDAPFARCVAGYLQPARPSVGGPLGELPPRRFFEKAWSWYTFDRRLTLTIPPPADLVRGRLDGIGHPRAKCWRVGRQPVRNLRVRLISNPTETRVEVTTYPEEDSVAGCFRRDAYTRLGFRDGGQWAIDHVIHESQPTFLTEERLRPMVAGVCNAMRDCLDGPAPPDDCPPNSMCMPYERKPRHRAENVKRLGLPEVVPLTVRARVESPAEPMKIEVVEAGRLDARLTSCIERTVKADAVRNMMLLWRPLEAFIDATPAITITKQCKTMLR